ncbi:MAG TPA: hypothetical protein VLA71_13295 [Algoriphagus sp.]|nr:hypothetical protein [Algoriphagus sp.]
MDFIRFEDGQNIADSGAENKVLFLFGCLIPDLSQSEMSVLMVTFPDDSKLEAFRVMDQVLNTRVDTNVPEVTVAIKG